MKKLLAIVVLGLMCSSISHARVFNYTCLMTESKNFQMVYQINDVRKTIKLLTSFDFKNKKKFEVFKNLTVIRFNKDNAYAVLELQGTTSLRYFNFKTGKKYQTSMLLYFLVF